MELKELFNSHKQAELEQRQKELDKQTRNYQLRCKWCEMAKERLSFLEDEGFTLDTYYPQSTESHPYLSILTSAGRNGYWAEIKAYPQSEDDLDNIPFYVSSNDHRYFYPGRKITFEELIEVVAKWI